MSEVYKIGNITFSSKQEKEAAVKELYYIHIIKSKFDCTKAADAKKVVEMLNVSGIIQTKVGQSFLYKLQQTIESGKQKKEEQDLEGVIQPLFFHVDEEKQELSSEEDEEVELHAAEYVKEDAEEVSEQDFVDEKTSFEDSQEEKKEPVIPLEDTAIAAMQAQEDERVAQLKAMKQAELAAEKAVQEALIAARQEEEAAAIAALAAKKQEEDAIIAAKQREEDALVAALLEKKAREEAQLQEQKAKGDAAVVAMQAMEDAGEKVRIEDIMDYVKESQNETLANATSQQSKEECIENEQVNQGNNETEVVSDIKGEQTTEEEDEKGKISFLAGLLHKLGKNKHKQEIDELESPVADGNVQLDNLVESKPEKDLQESNEPEASHMEVQDTQVQNDQRIEEHIVTESIEDSKETEESADEEALLRKFFVPGGSILSQSRKERFFKTTQTEEDTVQEDIQDESEELQEDIQEVVQEDESEDLGENATEDFQEKTEEEIQGDIASVDSLLNEVSEDGLVEENCCHVEEDNKSDTQKVEQQEEQEEQQIEQQEEQKQQQKENAPKEEETSIDGDDSKEEESNLDNRKHKRTNLYAIGMFFGMAVVLILFLLFVVKEVPLVVPLIASASLLLLWQVLAVLKARKVGRLSDKINAKYHKAESQEDGKEYEEGPYGLSLHDLYAYMDEHEEVLSKLVEESEDVYDAYSCFEWMIKQQKDVDNIEQISDKSRFIFSDEKVSLAQVRELERQGINVDCTLDEFIAKMKINVSYRMMPDHEKYDSIGEALEFFGDGFDTYYQRGMIDSICNELFEEENIIQRCMSEKDIFGSNKKFMNPYTFWRPTVSCVLSKEYYEDCKLIREKVDYVHKNLSSNIETICRRVADKIYGKDFLKSDRLYKRLLGELVIKGRDYVDSLSGEEQELIVQYEQEKEKLVSHPYEFQLGSKKTLDMIALFTFCSAGRKDKKKKVEANEIRHM